VCAIGQAHRAGFLIDLLHGDVVVHVPQAHPLVLLRHGEAVEIDGRCVERGLHLHELVHTLLELSPPWLG
jgi:hypothetical protein